MAPSPKKQLLYGKSDSNQPRTKLPTTVKKAVSSHTKFLLLIYKSNINLSCFEVCMHHYPLSLANLLAKIKICAMLSIQNYS